MLRSSLPTCLTVTTDASDVGWGYLSDKGHQACGGWSEDMRTTHSNLRELSVANAWLLQHPSVRDMGFRFDMDNIAAMRCLQVQGNTLLSPTEQIFSIAAERGITLSDCHIRGKENGWADSLSSFRGTSMEWHLDPKVFLALVAR